MISIVGVHGVRQLDTKHERDEIVAGMSQIWQAAAAQGIDCPAEQLDFLCAYYAPTLVTSFAPQSGDPLDLLPDEAKSMMMEWVSELGAPEPVTQARLGWPVRQAAQWVQNRAPWLASAMIAQFFREVDAYLRSPDGTQRTAAREEVATTIKQHQPDVIIAHSLGSVVTYEVLWEDPSLTADLLITLGSPLGMKPIRRRLQPSMEESLGRRPPGIQRWVNIADPGDLIAIPPHLKKIFGGIDSDLEESIGLLSTHSVTKYLGCVKVAATLAPLLLG